MQFSVKLLLTAVTLIAVCISAMIGANEQSMRLIASFVLLTNIVAATVAVVCSWPIRAFAIGYLIGCLSYLYLVHATRNGKDYLITDVSIEVIDHWLKLSVPKKTPTGETIRILNGGMAHIYVGDRVRRVTTWEEVEKMGYTKYSYPSDRIPTKLNFRAIGHFVVAILLATCNGTFALYLATRRRTQAPRKTAGSPLLADQTESAG